MKKEFTKDYMINNRECYSSEQVKDLFFNFSDHDISIYNILNADIPLKDKFWFVVKKTDLAIKEKQELSIGVASIVLVIYENKYPGDNRVRKAIEAAKEYLAGNIDREELISTRDAAYAAYYAGGAYAAYAAYAAARAADAAAAYYAAADAAAYAADAAAYVAARADAAYQESLFNYLKEFVNNH